MRTGVKKGESSNDMEGGPPRAEISRGSDNEHGWLDMERGMESLEDYSPSSEIMLVKTSESDQQNDLSTLDDQKEQGSSMNNAATPTTSPSSPTTSPSSHRNTRSSLSGFMFSPFLQMNRASVSMKKIFSESVDKKVN